LKNSTAKSSILNLKNKQLEYISIGSGKPVIALHGTPGGYDHASYYFRRLQKKGFNIIAVSRPGYLQTPLSSGKTVSEQAGILAALMDELKIDKCAVMAVSGGSPYALQFAINYPDRLTALTLDTPVAKKYTFHNPYVNEKIFTKFLFNNLSSWLIRTEAKYFPKLMLRQTIRNESTLERNERKELVKRIVANESYKIEYVRQSIYNSTPFGVRKAGLKNDLYNFSSLNLPVERITSPILITHGTADGLVPFNHAEYLAERIPHAEFDIIDKGFHILSLHPDGEKLWDRKIEFVKRYMR
jgi:pimeloyl-ACP methyl ester carboxylesterase